MQNGPHAPVRAEDGVGPIPSLDAVRPDPEDDRRVALLERLRSERIRLPPAHDVARLVSMEMKG